ncbi:transposase [Salinarimonas ramus]|uniref:Insertion element IS402-like domain-containing protein n=1 Tax=Salinarimonas ramus TaxID=690164 RepID=A0A917V7S5_9HYPH|nr:transposase [Salinarimonas ramus]GGK47228.1 hypothetical protein GCM10011322_37860 [Salinarimonas ramus]
MSANDSKADRPPDADTVLRVLGPVEEFVSALRSTAPNLSLVGLAIILAVVRAHLRGQTLGIDALANEVGLSYFATVRHTNQLGSDARKGGFGLLQKIDAPTDGRVRHVVPSSFALALLAKAAARLSTPQPVLVSPENPHARSPTRTRSSLVSELLPDRLDDGEWLTIEPEIRKRVSVSPNTDLRAVIDAYFFVRRTRTPWSQLPRGFPPKSTVFDIINPSRHRRHSGKDTRAHIDALLDQIELERAIARDLGQIEV